MPDQAFTIDGRVDATRGTFEQFHAQTALQFRERLGNGRLRYIGLAGCLADVAKIVQCDQQVQVPGFQVAAQIPVKLSQSVSPRFPG